MALCFGPVLFEFFEITLILKAPFSGVLDRLLEAGNLGAYAIKFTLNLVKGLVVFGVLFALLLNL